MSQRDEPAAVMAWRQSTMDTRSSLQVKQVCFLVKGGGGAQLLDLANHRRDDFRVALHAIFLASMKP